MSRKNILISFFVLVLFVAGVMAVAAKTASSPVSAAGVTPYIIDGANPGGNRTCAEVGLAFYGNADYYQYASAQVDYPALPDGFGIASDGTYVSWGPFAHNGLAMIVKGRDDANVYVYEPPTFSDSGLASPITASGNPADLSNLTVCWNPPVVVQEPQWCSPGYWRQPHHLHAWAATGISPDEYYNDYFDPDLPGNPTLLYVLQNPQRYQRLGGDPFNRVGDLLSAAHPDVNFTGERVNNSCPL